MKIKDLLTDKSKWIQTRMAEDKKGQPVFDPCQPSAVKWCLVGAMIKAYEHPEYRDMEPAPKIAAYLEEFYGWKGLIGEWNDAQDRTFAEVRKLIEDLDI